MAPASPDFGEARVARRIVLYLARRPALTSEDVPPPEYTQAGLAEAIVATQGAVAKITARLVAVGILVEELRHVQGANRRLKVYSLTWRGRQLAVELEARWQGGQTPRASRPPEGFPGLDPD